MALALILAGLVLALLSFRQLNRLLREVERAPARLDLLVDELVATAEATTGMVADRAEALSSLLAAADERIAQLRQLEGAPALPVPSMERPAAPPSAEEGRPLAQPLAEAVRLRVAAGQDQATIARELGLARSALGLALRASKGGGEG